MDNKKVTVVGETKFEYLEKGTRTTKKSTTKKAETKKISR